MGVSGQVVSDWHTRWGQKPCGCRTVAERLGTNGRSCSETGPQSRKRECITPFQAQCSTTAMTECRLGPNKKTLIAPISTRHSPTQIMSAPGERHSSAAYTAWKTARHPHTVKRAQAEGITWCTGAIGHFRPWCFAITENAPLLVAWCLPIFPTGCFAAFGHVICAAITRPGALRHVAVHSENKRM